MQHSAEPTDNDAVSHSRHVGTRVVDRRWLYNNMFVGPIVVDVRPPEDTAQNTVVGAVSIPPMEHATSMSDIEAQLLPPHRENFTPTKRFLREIVLVGEADDASRQWQHRLQTLLIQEAKVASVVIMDDGFAEFYSKYPFYTTVHQPPAPDPTTIRRITYPNEILDRFLYLGNMWHAKSDDIIRDLGITHIVNATLDLGNVFEGRGVRYHEVKIPDNSDADISSHFNPTFVFIAGVAAIQPPSKHFRVLVHCTQGISRSATLVLMYLMRMNQWSLVKAFNHTQRSRPVIIPNSGFFRALLEDERRLFHGVNSLHESEIDALLQGRIDDRDATIPYDAASGTATQQASTSHSTAFVRKGRDTCALM